VVVIYQPTLARNIPNSLNIEVQLKFNLAFTMPTYTKNAHGTLPIALKLTTLKSIQLTFTQ